jgi:hypothetical protein
VPLSSVDLWVLGFRVYLIYLRAGRGLFGQLDYGSQQACGLGGYGMIPKGLYFMIPFSQGIFHWFEIDSISMG